MSGLIAASDRAGATNGGGDLRHCGPDAQASIWREEHRPLLAICPTEGDCTRDGADQHSWKSPREVRFVEVLPRFKGEAAEAELREWLQGRKAGLS
jgi:hypothetical protein